jgi:DNA-directed RNA polymerase subunit M/transcription elongation factor TFIIS
VKHRLPFEEIDANPVVRGHEKTPRYPLADPASIICPDCNSATLRHDRKTTQIEGITHFYTCRDCDTKFGIQCDVSDPISKARKAAVDAARILCPNCAGTTRQKDQTKTKTGATIRRECNECKHRFKSHTPFCLNKKQQDNPEIGPQKERQMTPDEMKKLVEDAVRIGVREALQAEQQKKDDAEREKV